MDKIVYYVFLAFVWFMGILPKGLRRGIFFIISRFAYFFARKTNRIIKTNLDFVFDKEKLSKEEITQIQKYSYFNMILWVQTMIENLKANEDEIKDSIVFENREILDNLIKENKKVILISAHFGNMEMLSYGINKFVTPLVQVARESNFSLIDKFVTKSRESTGSTIIYRDGALRHLVKALIKNRVVSLIIDQNINNKDGSEVLFLNKKVNQSVSAASLARKFDAYVVPLAAFNQDDGTYIIKIYDAIEPIKTDDEKSDIKSSLQLQADALSKIILEDKKQWFWPHKRFKFHNKEIYE